ncbi:MAG: PAS domain S-box protein, partial [Oscillochloris sp.]|nr:PAS domain S-box protein [Oscillochloris sp.]
MTQVPHSTADGNPPPAASTPNDMPASPASPWSNLPWTAIHSATTSETAQQFILYEIVQQLTRELDPDIIIQRAVNTIMQLNRWQSIGISLLTSDAQHWQTRAENRMAPGEVGTYHEINTGVIGRAYRTGTIQLVPDVHSDPDFFLAEGVTHINSELAIPISFDGNVLGVMNLESDQRAAFDQSDITFAQSISNILALALKNAQRFTAIQQEISERAQSEARFTTTFHHSPVAMVITRLDDNIMIETNNAWLDLLEYSREEIIGYSALSIGIWANPQDRHYLISSLQIHHRITDFETTIYAKSGRMLHVLVSAEQTMIVNDMCMLFQVTDITARKQAEIAQRASEEKYRGLIRSLDSIIAAVDDKSRFLYLNDVAAALFNNTPDMLVGKTIYDVFPESATLSYLEQSIRKVIHEDCGQVAEYQSQFLGKAHWYRISMQPIHHENGNVAYVLINATDIHDLKTAQQELLELTHTLEDRVKERTAEVQDLYENSPNGYHSLDTSGIITMVNQTELTWLGYTREEMLGQPFIDFITEPSRRTFFDNYMIFKQRGWVRDIEYELTRKDGTTFPILLNATAIYDDAGNFVMSRSTAFDNTERKKAEDALRDSQANLQNFLDTASDLIQSLDSRGNIQYVNNAWCETLGYTADEALQLSVFHVIDPAYHDHCRMVLNNLMLSKQSQQMEVIFRTKHGRAVVVEGSVSGRQHNDGQCSTNGIFRDITRRKQAEETLRIAHAEMERALRTKDEFLANMSHELRTPLNAILTLSESLLEEVRGPLSARQQESVQHIEESGRHLLALINDILDLSKVEAGRLDLQIEVVSVADVCRSSLQFVKEIAIKKQIQLGFHLSDELAEMEVDPRRLKQMLVNLLSNAVKFTPAGGQVSLDVSIQPGEEVVSFAVRDTGIGIPSEGMQRLFRPFTQLDSSLNRQHEGTGL